VSSLPSSEQPIGPGLRVLLAVIGAAAVAAGSVVVTAELQSTARSPLSILAVAFCVVIVVGGAVLIRGAMRGRIRFRRNR
jgi:hypothetical protein